MPEFVIEREAPGIGEQSAFQQSQTVRRNCSALHGVEPGIEWVQSYLTGNKVYCVFRAPSEQALRELIAKWDLPEPLSICEVHEVIAPDNGERA
jgi:hypothetical protein